MTTDNKNVMKDETSDKNNKKKNVIKIILKAILIIVIILMLLVLAPMQTTTFKTLQNGEWDNQVGTICFGDRGHFAFYNGGSGSPVGVADLYPYYIYLGNKFFITLGDFPIKTGKIHHIDDRCLILTYDKETYVFSNLNAMEDGDERVELNEYATCDKCFKTVKDPDTLGEYFSIVDMNESSITLSPFEFNNKRENKAYSYTMDITDDIKFDYSKLTSELIDEFNMRTHKCKAKDITKKEAISLIKDKSLKAYVGFDETGKISDILVVDANITTSYATTMERLKIDREREKREMEKLEEDLYPEGEQ